MSDPDSPVTALLAAHMAGEPQALADLFPLVLRDLRALAGAYMARERPGHSLQPTELVNEAYLRLVHIDRMDWKGKAHFLAMAATAMRRVLVEHARARDTLRRGQGLLVEALDGESGFTDEGSVELLAVDVALEKLARVSPRQVRIVELRFFGGATIEEAAEALGVGRDVVKSDWRFARAWLQREIRGRTRTG